MPTTNFRAFLILMWRKMLESRVQSWGPGAPRPSIPLHQTETGSKGFTLVEVAVAVVLLGVGFVTLIGLQTAYVDHYLHDHNLTRAALYAQYHVAILESDAEVPDSGSIDQALYDVLKKDGYFEDEESASAKEEFFKGWRYEQTVAPIGVPPIEDALRRIDATVSWGDRAKDRFTIVYFVPADSEEPDDDPDANS